MFWKSPSADRIVAAGNRAVYRVNGRSLAEQSWLACGTGAGVVANLSRGFRNRSFQVMFFFSVFTMCYASYQLSGCFVHWHWCIRGTCSAATYCDAIAFWNSLLLDRGGTVASNLKFER